MSADVLISPYLKQALLIYHSPDISPQSFSEWKYNLYCAAHKPLLAADLINIWEKILVDTTDIEEGHRIISLIRHIEKNA